MDIEALRELLVRYAQRSGSLEPEDCAHNIIERVWRKDRNFDRPRQYWFVAARNEARGEARRNRCRPLNDEVMIAPPDVRSVPLREQVLAELVADVDICIDWYESLWEHRPGAVKVRAFRARRRLQKALT